MDRGQADTLNAEYYFREGCYVVEVVNSHRQPAMSIARIRVEPGVTTRWHALHNTLERYLILQGHGRMETGQRGAYSVSPGDWVTIPADVRQRITNTGDDDLVFLAICSPRFRPACYRE